MQRKASPPPSRLSCGGRRNAAAVDGGNAASCFRERTPARNDHPAPAVTRCSTSCSTLPASNVTPQNRAMVRHGVGIEGCYTPGCSTVEERSGSTPDDRRRRGARGAGSRSRSKSKGATSARHRKTEKKSSSSSSAARRRTRKTSSAEVSSTEEDCDCSPDLQKAAADICGVMSVMRSYPRDLDAQILGCDELRKYSQDPDNAVAIAVAGGIRTVLLAMETHSGSVSVASYGIECLHNLAKNRKHRPRILMQGGLKVLVDAIDTHSDCFVVRSFGCNTLSKILTGKENRKDFDEAGGLQAMMKVLSSFSSEEKVLSGTYKVLKKVGYDPNWELFIWNRAEGMSQAERQSEAGDRKATKEESNCDTSDCLHTPRGEKTGSPPSSPLDMRSEEDQFMSSRSSQEQEEEDKDKEGEGIAFSAADFLLSPNTPREGTTGAARGSPSPIQAAVGPREMLALLNTYPEDESLLRLTYKTLKDQGYDPAEVLSWGGQGKEGGDVPPGIQVSPTSTNTSGSSAFRSCKSNDSTPSPFDKNSCIEDELDFRHFISLTSRLETSWNAVTKKRPRRRSPVFEAAPGA